MHNPLNRRFAAATIVSALFGLVAVLPAAPASADASRDTNQLSLNAGSGTSLGSPGTSLGSPGTSLGSPATTVYELDRLLTPTEVQKLLAGLPIGKATGAISPEALAKALAGLPALQSLKIGNLEASLKSTLEGLGSGATLTVLQDPTSLVSGVVTTVEKLLDLEELLNLDGLLGGESLSNKLEGALLNVNLSELLPGLLSSSGSPQALLEELLSGMPASLVEEILGSKLSGSPTISVTVSELAADLGVTVEALLKQLGETTAQLPETVHVLLDPLANGELLSVLDGTNRVLLGTLSSLLDLEGGEGTEGTEGTKGAEGTKGTEGTEGTKGAEGTKGTEGTEGTKGAEGTKGTEGTEGTKPGSTDSVRC